MDDIIGKKCIVRTDSAGVHFGEVTALTGKEVRLKNARRIWSWVGAFTLSAVAVAGVSVGSRLSVPVAMIVLTEAVEIIPATDVAVANLEGHPTWTP